MSTKVSKSQIETHGRGEYDVIGEQKAAEESTESRSYAEAYQALLARELLTNELQEDYSKCF